MTSPIVCFFGGFLTAFLMPGVLSVALFFPLEPEVAIIRPNDRAAGVDVGEAKLDFDKLYYHSGIQVHTE